MEYSDNNINRTLVEEWRPVKDYEGLYEVSNLGNVRSVKTKTLNSQYTRKGGRSHGQVVVVLFKNGVVKQKRVSRLVATAFIDNPNHTLYGSVAHRDGNKSNNVISNLYWCNQSEIAAENILHTNENKKIPVEQYTLGGKFVREWKSASDASKELGINRKTIQRCCVGKLCKQASGFIWKYKNDQTPIRPYKSQNKKVYKYSLDGELLNIYESISAAARANFIDKNSIKNCALGKQRTSHNYIWKFEKK